MAHSIFPGTTLGDNFLGVTDSFELFARFPVVVICLQEMPEPQGGIVEPRGSLADVGQRLERHHILSVEVENPGKGRFRGGGVLEVQMTPTQDYPGRRVVWVMFEPHH